MLELLAESPVPAPCIVAADPAGAVCDVPTLLTTRLPGHPPGLPHDMDAVLMQLAEALVVIHAVDDRATKRIPGYRTYIDLTSAAPPRWSRRPQLWERALELASAQPPPGPRCLIHRDYHPENTLRSRGRLSGIVDWTSGSWGPAAVDIGHMRWNLAVAYGLDAAAAFLRLYRSVTSVVPEDQHYWDLVTLLDLVCNLDPHDLPPRFDLARL